MKERSEISDDLKWDLNLFRNNEEIEEIFKLIEINTQNANKYYGKFNNKEIFFQYFSKENQLIDEKVERLSFYISNMLNVDNSNVEMLKLQDRLNNALTKNFQAYSYVSSQLSELDENYLVSLLNDERAKDYTNKIKEIIKNKKHSLDEKSNQLIASISNSFNNSETIFETFTNSEMTFAEALDSSNKAHTVSNAEYSKFLTSKDRVLRKNAFNSLMNGFGSYNKTFAELFISFYKSEKESAKLHKYEDILAVRLNDEDVPRLVYENNVKSVEKHIPLLQEYVSILNKESGLNDYSYYDLFVNATKDDKISISQAHQTLIKAVAPLGEEYVNIVKKKLTDKSIDYMPNKNKRSGAYCSNAYNCKTVILMNWTNDYNSLTTLTHEMGHCINAEYFNSVQPYTKAGITIFAAEMASTVNEILLNQYMQSISSNEGKKYYIKEFLNDVRSTIYRQTLFSEFELFMQKQIINETPITYIDLNQEYYRLNEKYYGKSCILPENLKYEWSRIPHFYTPFYVYSYSTGLITAINLAIKILNEKDYYKKYIEFLKNGTNRPAVEILKEIGIDLTTSEPFENAFNFIKKQLDEYKSISK